MEIVLNLPERLCSVEQYAECSAKVEPVIASEIKMIERLNSVGRHTLKKAITSGDVCKASLILKEAGLRNVSRLIRRWTDLVNKYHRNQLVYQ